MNEPTTLAINLPVRLDWIVEVIGHSDAKELILALDRKVAEVDFTLEILADLFKSLQSDMTREEIIQELDSITA